MNRVEFLKTFSCSSEHPDSASLYSALVNCLTAEEASDLLLATLTLDPERRHVVARKVFSDLDVEVSDCHLRMLDALIAELGEFRVPKPKYTARFYTTCMADFRSLTANELSKH